ncbi:hypothetical protein PHJA_000679300 [Phtheirospermum japonicum]|uniref:VQ domain-containing protein n=1 Tax=Phtheirospermum japonicum TaxID=374723 RepID=A0A830BEI7_9LAMI|nr:hypothetical protein PHJA_000679300 [Phtheirospermum japonicum]
MRTPKFHDSDVTNEVINGPRSSPLRINKDSHAIHKSSSFSSSSPSHNHQPVSGGGAARHHGGASAAKRPPVIIYTQSPRIIHTQAHEFMTLVQKLTGLDRAGEEKADQNHAKSDQSESTTDEGSISNEDKDTSGAMVKSNSDYNNYVGYEENESSSGLTTDEKFVASDSSPVSSMYKVSSMNNMNPYMIDAPFFGPGSSDFLCSSRPNSMFRSPSVGNQPISPSLMDFAKGFPDY